MAWADEARCLHCNGKLPLFRKLRNGQFCSTQHEKEYWAEQERLAVEVLHRTHDVLMAYKPMDDVELIIGPAVEWNPSPSPADPPRYEAPRYETPRPEPQRYEAPKYEAPRYEPPAPAREEPRIEPAPAAMAGFFRSLGPEECTPVWGNSPTMFVEEPAPCEVLQIDLGALAMAIREAEVTLAEANAIAIPLHMAENAVTVDAPAPITPSPIEALLIESSLEPTPIEFEREELPPPMGDWQPLPLHMAEQAAVLADVAAPITPSIRALLIESSLEPAPIEFEAPEEPPPPMGDWQPLPLHMAEYAVAADTSARSITPSIRALLIESSLQPESIEFEPEEPIPPMGQWQPMPMWAALAPAEAVAQPAAEQVTLIPPMVRMVIRPIDASAFTMRPAGLRETPASRPSASVPVAENIASLAWLRLWSVRIPVVPALAAVKKEPGLRMAGGSRYATATEPAPAPAGVSAGPLDFGSRVQTPEYPALSHQDLHRALNMEFLPDEAGLLLLQGMRGEIDPQRPAKAPVRPAPADVEPFPTEPWIPGSKQEPIRWNLPSPESISLEPDQPTAPPVASTPAEKSPPPSFLHTVSSFWTKAPRDLRLLIFAIPMLLALAFHPSLPKVHVSTVQATEPMQTKVGDAVNGSWNNFKMAVSQRAAVALDEDFRQGLDEWQSPGGVATEWSFDANGFVRPGSLALYSPSVNLTDYQAQFLAIIDKKALSWVIRAADFDNYYVVKLVVLKPGPLTTLGMTRYAVIKGKAQDRKDSLVPLTARPDMIYRVRVDVHDDSFAVAIQGQMVDAWSEPRLRRGGIGFFSARGEASRVRWVQVTHQYDTLGRLCSYLAPYDLAAANSLTETTTNTNTTTNNSNQNGSWKP